MDETRSKIISEIETDENVVSVKKPFALHKDKSRHYIRLEISEPLSFSILRDRENGFRTQPNEQIFQGSILNISAGGVLIETETPLGEGSLITMKMSLQEVETIDHVIGLVKRADADENMWLIGIEFISREYLVDHFSSAELEIIPPELASFDERLKMTLNKYVQYKRNSATNQR